MGKSIKKAKSERINALRKQYDAFLEEERKRKDRNNYIMEWLDKLQTSSTVSSLRFQERTTRENQNRLLMRPEFEQKNQYLPRLPNIRHPLTENLEETAILKAVSQKYILIPKTSQEQNKNQNNYSVENFSNIDDDSDWKSKYNILDVLKQDEKEEKASSLYSENVTNKDAQVGIPTKDKNIVHEVYQPQGEIIQKQIVKNMHSSEKSSMENNQRKFYEKNDLNINDIDKDLKYDVTEPTVSDCLEKNNYTGKSDMQVSQLELLNDHDKTNLHNQIQNQNDSLEQPKHDEKTERLRHCSTSGNDSLLEPLKAQSDSNNRMSSEGIPGISIGEEVSQHYNSSSTELSDIKVVSELNDLPLNHQIRDVKVQNKEINYCEEGPLDISDSKPQLEIGDTTPQITDKTLEDQSQIEEFETEQKDLFYSEEQNVNYSYDEEQVTGDTYENDKQYSYYEVTKEDPNKYGTSINEYEESTEPYDPHYQQQFSTNTYEENPIQTQFPVEDYHQNETVDYQQQQFYENDAQQLTNLGTQQQLDENCVYEENQGNVENIYVQDFGQESTLQNEALEHNVEHQLNIEDSLTEGNETHEENSTQKKPDTDLTVT